MRGGWCTPRKSDCCVNLGIRGRFGREAGEELSCKGNVNHRKLCKRRPITANGVREENASLQQQGVDQYKKNLVIPTQLMGKVRVRTEKNRGLTLASHCSDISEQDCMGTTPHHGEMLLLEKCRA